MTTGGGGSRIGIRLKDREAFGGFCEVLTEDGVPFSHAGFLTVILTTTQFDRLPPLSQEQIDLFKAKGLVELFPVTRGAKRPPLPTRGEAEELMRKFTPPR